MTEWIKCSERLPDCKVKRILFTDGKTVYSGFLFRILDSTNFIVPKYIFRCCYQGNSISATHWAETPLIPKNDI